MFLEKSIIRIFENHAGNIVGVNKGIYMELTQRADDRKVGRSWNSRQEEGVENWVEKKGKVFGVKNWRRGERLYPTMGPSGIKRERERGGREGYIWSDNDNARRALLCVLRWRSPLVRINCVQPDRPRWPYPPIKTIDRYLTHRSLSLCRYSHSQVLSFPDSPETTDKYSKYPRNEVILTHREKERLFSLRKYQRLRLISRGMTSKSVN